VYDEDVAVFKQDIQAAWKPDRGRASTNFQHISGLHGTCGDGAGLSIHPDAPLRKHLTQSSIRGTGYEEPKSI
jgi:hypothetical protein